MKEPIQFNENDDIVEICKDSVFKAVFTKDTPESKGALSKLVSALIGREVSIIEILANEMPVSSLCDRQVRFDINCEAENGELINVEMCFNPQKSEPARLEYHAAKLFISQDIKGKNKKYKDLLQVYQIAILAKISFFSDEVFYHSFEYYDFENKMPLGGKTRIITIELCKLENQVKKSIEEMNAKERWAVFFRYLTQPDKRGIINGILKHEEGIAMAGEVIRTISRDLRERLILNSIEKAEMDYRFFMAEARDEGLEMGREMGLEMGRAEGLAAGRREHNKYVLDCISQGLSVEEIKQKLENVQ